MGIEAVIETMVVERAKQLGWVAKKLKWIGSRDAPDHFFAKGGRVVLVEFKAPGEEPRETQAREIQLLRSAGVEVHLISSTREGYALFEKSV